MPSSEDGGGEHRDRGREEVHRMPLSANGSDVEGVVAAGSLLSGNNAPALRLMGRDTVPLLGTNEGYCTGKYYRITKQRRRVDFME